MHVEKNVPIILHSNPNFSIKFVTGDAKFRTRLGIFCSSWWPMLDNQFDVYYFPVKCWTNFGYQLVSWRWRATSFNAKETYLPIRMKSVCRRLGYLICCLQYQLNSKYISKKTRNEMKHKSESWVKRCSILYNTSRLLASSCHWNCQKQFLRKSVFSFYQAIMIPSLESKMFQPLDTQEIVNSSLELIYLHI